MEISNALLVAIMFVTLLAMGIGNILVSMSGSLTAHRASRERLHTSWRILLLLVHFNLFWYTLDLLNVEQWVFGRFLAIIAGPILLFFATSVLLDASKAVDEDAPTLAPARFFVLLALVQLWSFSTDFFLGADGFTRAGLLDLTATVVLLFLATRAGSYQSQLAGNIVVWLWAAMVLALKGLGVVH